MRSQEQQIQQQFDVYYQGTQQQLLALLYPLGGPHAHTFQHMKQQRVTYQPATKQLSYTYQLQNFDNIDRKKQPITYTSKLVENKSNYFYSVFDQITGTFVWRNVGGFVQMRPKTVSSREADIKKAQTAIKQPVQSTTTTINKKGQQQALQAAIQLTVIQSGSQQNVSQKQMYNAPISQTKAIWECSKQQYFAYLSN